MDDQKNIRPDFSKAGEDSILYKKEEPKTEREKLKELHGKDKIWYLVHYYGLQTMVALAMIGTISFLIIHYITQQDTALEIMAVNAIQSADNPAGDSGYYNDFLKENGLDPDKSEVLVSSNLGASANENDGASAESIQMIQSLFMTQSVDVFFSDYDFFYSLGEFDYFTDIRECFPEEVLEKYKDDIVYVKSTETGKKYPIGIKLKGNAWVEKTGWYPDTCVVGLAAGLKNKDHTCYRNKKRSRNWNSRNKTTKVSKRRITDYRKFVIVDPCCNGTPCSIKNQGCYHRLNLKSGNEDTIKCTKEHSYHAAYEKGYNDWSLQMIRTGICAAKYTKDNRTGNRDTCTNRNILSSRSCCN